MFLLIQPEYPPAVGGMQTHAAALAQGLSERGHNVAVITYAQTDDHQSAESYDASQPFPTYRCLRRLSYWGNVRTIQEYANRLNPEIIYSSTPFYGIMRTVANIPTVCRSVGTDITRCWIPYPFRFGSQILSLPAVDKKLYELYQRMHAPAWMDDILYSARRDLVRLAACNASALAANSHYTRDRLLEIGVDPSVISVVPGGVAASRFAGGNHTTLRARIDKGGADPLILTVCRLVMKKGIDVLLEAVALARKELPRLQLLIVGDGPERKKCEQLAAELGLGSSVRFLGKVPHEEIVGYYHSADLFVLASRVHRRRKSWADVETMGRVICEANAAGIPVIASNTGGVPSLITDNANGLLVTPNNPAHLAATIVSLWRNPSLQAGIIAGGLQRAREEFDWDIVINTYEGIFRKTIANKEKYEPFTPGQMALLR